MSSSKGARGFSLVEMVIVIAIILIASAVALPSLVGYVRIYRLRGGTQQVRSEIQAARMRAIARNVNQGVLFVVWSPTQFRWVLEDLPGPPDPLDVTPPPAPAGPAPLAWDDPGAMRSTLQTLPEGIIFDPAPPAPAAAPTSCTFRFTRLGMYANPGPAAPACAAGQLVLANGAGGSAVTLLDTRTGVRRMVTVQGGRIEAPQ